MYTLKSKTLVSILLFIFLILINSVKGKNNNDHLKSFIQIKKQEPAPEVASVPQSSTQEGAATDVIENPQTPTETTQEGSKQEIIAQTTPTQEVTTQTTPTQEVTTQTTPTQEVILKLHLHKK